MPEENVPVRAVRDNSKFYTPGAILLGAVIIGIALIIGLTHGTSGSNAGSRPGPEPGPAVNIKDVKTAGEPYIGQANAPVVMAYWSDYQCPFCKAFEVGGVQGIQQPAVMPTLLTEYVNTGKLKVIFKDFPFLGNDSTTAAEYGRAIWELYPAQFFAWRTAMFKAQDAEGDQGFGNADSIDQLIKMKFPQMDDVRIKQAVQAKKAKYDAAIEADKQEGATFGVNGTPGFVTGTTFIGGFDKLARFTAVIDAQLK